jgi:hypothetical protein
MTGRFGTLLGTQSGVSTRNYPNQPPVVRPPFKFLHDTLTGAKVRVSGAGGRYPSALCGRCVLHIRSLCLTLALQMPRFIVLTCGLLVCCAQKSCDTTTS